MPILFRIFLVFFLKQTFGVLKDNGIGITQVNLDQTLVYAPLILQLKGEQSAIDQLINQCNVEFPSALVQQYNGVFNKTGDVEACVLFSEPPYITRTNIIGRLKIIQSQAVFQWLEF